MLAEIDATVRAVNLGVDEISVLEVLRTATLGFLVGQVMKASEGKANPKVVNELLKKTLS